MATLGSSGQQDISGLDGSSPAARESDIAPTEVTHSAGIPMASDKETQLKASASLKNAYHPEFYSKYYSEISKTWVISPIRGLLVLESTPGLLSILVGKPNATTFPIRSFSMSVRSPVPPFTETTLTIEDDMLTDALQYGLTAGHPYLVDQLVNLQTELHGRVKDASWRLNVGAGSQDLLYKAFTAFTDPGDVVLIEAPTYAGVLPILRSCKADFVEVPVDGMGIVSSSLRDILENWPKGKKYPKYLYTVPYGCNPTGATATVERRREVLALARQYEFLILEDDPYYLLYYGPTPRPASYFSLEAMEGNRKTGLVVRFDSLSKVLSSGIRVGFITGPTVLLDRMNLFTQSANLQPSSLSQSVVYALLKHWGTQGFVEHCGTVSAFYRQRKDVFEAALKKHLDGLIEYTSPISGMFLWFKLKIPASGETANGSDPEEGDSSSLIRERAFKAGVLALPGTSFFPDGRTSAYVRASFSMLSDEDIDEAVRRLSVVVKEARTAEA